MTKMIAKLLTQLFQIITAPDLRQLKQSIAAFCTHFLCCTSLLIWVFGDWIQNLICTRQASTLNPSHILNFLQSMLCLMLAAQWGRHSTTSAKLSLDKKLKHTSVVVMWNYIVIYTESKERHIPTFSNLLFLGSVWAPYIPITVDIMQDYLSLSSKTSFLREQLYVLDLFSVPVFSFLYSFFKVFFNLPLLYPGS